MKLSPRDLYRLRRTQLDTETRALRATMAQNNLKSLALELERKYGLLGKNASVDVNTGEITDVAPLAMEEMQDGSARDAHSRPSGPA